MKRKIRRIIGYIEFILIVAVLIYLGHKYSIVDRFKQYAAQNTQKKEIISYERKSIDELENIAASYKAENVLEKMKMQSKVLKIIARKALKKKMWKTVIKSLEKAKEYDSLNARDYYRLAVAYANLGWEETNKKKKTQYFKKARLYYKASLKIISDYPSSLYGLGILEFHIFKHYKKGIFLLESIVNSKNLKNTALALRAKLALAQMYFIVKRYKDARYYYEDLLSDLPKGDAMRTVCIKNIEKINKIIYGR